MPTKDVFLCYSQISLHLYFSIYSFTYIFQYIPSTIFIMILASLQGKPFKKIHSTLLVLTHPTHQNCKTPAAKVKKKKKQKVGEEKKEKKSSLKP